MAEHRSEPDPDTSTRLRLVSKPQVSGWRFMVHRLEHALIRRETAVRDDPQKAQSTASIVGVVLAVIIVIGATILSFFSPKGAIDKNTRIVADNDTKAIYVHLEDGKLYPVTNLTSARLIVGSPLNPVNVKGSAIAKTPRGPLLGIAGAPGEMVPSSDSSSQWALCDTASEGSAVPLDTETGEPVDSSAGVSTAAIAGRLSAGIDTAMTLGPNDARLFVLGDQTWLLYRESSGLVVRSQVDMSDQAVVDALGLASVADATPVSPGLFNAVPARPELSSPEVAGAGTVSRVSVGGDRVDVGSVLRSDTVSGPRYFVVLADGVQQVSRTVASVVQASGGRGQLRVVAADEVARLVRVHGLAVDHFPAEAVRVIDDKMLPVTCWQWSKSTSDPAAATEVLVGRALPVTAGQREAMVSLVTGPTSGGRTVDTASIPYATGRFVRVTGSDPTNLTKESLWWVSDTGVRFGISVDNSIDATDRTVAALGIGNPVPAPWSVVKMFAIGPTLSQRDARIRHDGMNLDSDGASLPSTRPGETAGSN